MRRLGGVDPLDAYPGAGRPWRCRCLSCGKEVRPRLATVRSGAKGCKGCAHKGVRTSESDAVAEMIERGNVTPLEPFKGVEEPWLCRCNRCGTEVSPRLGSVRSGRGACRHCGRRSTSAAQRIPEDIAVAEMRRLGNATPLEPYPGRSRPWRCRCNRCGEIVTPHFSSIRQGGKACRHCAARDRGRSQRLSTAQAVDEMKTRGKATPLQPFLGVNSPWVCRCDRCSRIVTPRLSSIRGGRSACRHCGHAERGAARRTAEADAVELMQRLGNATPLEPFTGVGNRWACRCNVCQQVVHPTYANVKAGNGACFSCGRAKAGAKRAVPDDVAVDEMERLGNATPLEPYPGARSRWKCRCKRCGSEIQPRLSVIRRGDGACKYCAQYGINYAEPTVLYLVMFNLPGGRTAVKIGIANESSARIKTHERRGWHLVDCVLIPTGEEAEQAEKAIIARWREKGCRSVRKALIPKGDGYTETAYLDEIGDDVPDLGRFGDPWSVESAGESG
jgi:hypothetical protein